MYRRRDINKYILYIYIYKYIYRNRHRDKDRNTKRDRETKSMTSPHFNPLKYSDTVLFLTNSNN